jgi:hypothetical protein
MCHSIDRWNFTDVSEEHTAPSFRLKSKPNMQPISKNPEDEGSTFL